MRKSCRKYQTVAVSLFNAISLSCSHQVEHAYKHDMILAPTHHVDQAARALILNSLAKNEMFTIPSHTLIPPKKCDLDPCWSPLVNRYITLSDVHKAN